MITREKAREITEKVIETEKNANSFFIYIHSG